MAAINQTADFRALAAWRENATTVHNLRYHKDSGAFGRGFSQRRMERLAAALGRDRLMRLFQSQAAA
jgi:hypothetical protein